MVGRHNHATKLFIDDLEMCISDLATVHEDIHMGSRQSTFSAAKRLCMSNTSGRLWLIIKCSHEADTSML